MTTHTPHPSTNLRYLLDIRANNYIGRKGKEYVASEVDNLINDKQQRRLTTVIHSTITEQDTTQRELREFVAALRIGFKYLSLEARNAITRDLKPICERFRTDL